MHGKPSWPAGFFDSKKLGCNFFPSNKYSKGNPPQKRPKGLRFSRSFAPQKNRGTIFSRETCNFMGVRPKVGDAARLVMGKATSAEDAALAPLGVNSGGAAGGGGSGWECYFKSVLESQVLMPNCFF